jgi:hypothetical protein
VSGLGEAGATIKLYTSTNQQVGTATVDSTGLWSTHLNVLADAKGYAIFATATDAAGNVSQASAMATFSVDTAPPAAPTYTKSYTVGSNLVSFSGSAEAGTLIELVNTAGGFQTIAHATADANGNWHIDTAPIPNGNYGVKVISSDAAGNGTSATISASWTVNSAANITGTSGADTIKPDAGNNGVDGGGGIDTAVYAGSKNNYTVTKADWGFDVVDKTGANGHDSLINVERIQFDDGFVAIDDNAAQLYRLYSSTYGREPDAAGEGYWLMRMDNGASIQQVSREFMLGGSGLGQPEFVALYGANPTNDSFLTQLYHNILGREPDAAGYQYWINVMNTYTADKTVLRGQMLIDFSDGPENLQKVALVGTLEHGVAYTPFHA